MSWTPEDRARLGRLATETHYGYLDGYRDLHLRTQYETAAWRERAKEHDEARRRLNALLPPPSIARHMKRGVTFFGDHTVYESARVQEALTAYRMACAQALAAPDPKPRRIGTLIRLAAEVAGAPDPVWSPNEWGAPINVGDTAFNLLFRQTERALRAGGLTDG